MAIAVGSSAALVVKTLDSNPVKAADKDKSNNGVRHAYGHRDKDKVSANMDGIYKSLTVLASEIKTKLEEILGPDLPKGGLEALKPEDFTPDKTADMIVMGTTAMMSTYAKQNPNLQGEELISGFMKTIRGGIKDGYEQAKSILKDVGAFQFDGVEDGISKTMSIVEEKLKAFEDQWRKDNMPAKEAEEAKEPAEQDQNSGGQTNL